MHSADGRFVISYNGEVYSHVEIRKELEAAGQRFWGHSIPKSFLNRSQHWEQFLSRKSNWEYLLWNVSMFEAWRERLG